MRGHIRRRSKTNWVVIIELERDPETHKRRSKWYGGHRTRRAAEAKLAEVLGRGPIQSSSMTLAEYLNQWLDLKEMTVRRRTVEDYRALVDGHMVPHLGKLKLSELRPHHLQAYLMTLLKTGRLNGKGGLSAQTVKHHHTVIKSALNQALRWGLVERNVAMMVDPPRVPKYRHAVLDTEGVSKLLKVSEQSPYYPLILLAIYTGLRRSELLGLRWRDVDFEGGTIAVTQVMHRLRSGDTIFDDPKSEYSNRRISLPATAQDVLQAHRNGSSGNPDGLVFVSTAGASMAPHRVSQAFKRIAKSAGLDVRLHDLRHTHATLMLSQNIHPKVVQERLGHSTISTTMDIYSHSMPRLDREAADLFDEVLKPTE